MFVIISSKLRVYFFASEIFFSSVVVGMIYFGQKNGNVKTKGQQQTKKERTNNMKTISKITQTRHFKKSQLALSQQ